MIMATSSYNKRDKEKVKDYYFLVHQIGAANKVSGGGQEKVFDYASLRYANYLATNWRMPAK